MSFLNGLKSARQRPRRLVPLRPSCWSRPLSSSRPTFSQAASIYVSESHDPWFNLAFEDWLFRKTDPEQKILYMYRNSPSVIIGRNQNPWKEINLARLRELDIPFVRRKSGGGTVYHDLGNTNYCVFVPRTEFDRKTNAELVVRGLQKLDLAAYVSGSAFKLVNKRAYHHGTMLIDAKLGDLRGVLGSQRDSMVTKGVASVPSPVQNLREFSAAVDHEQFVQVVADEFAAAYGLSRDIKASLRVDASEADRNEYVRAVVEELKSWEWQYGQTPEFTHVIAGTLSFGPLEMTIQSRHGLITHAELTRAPPEEWRVAAPELCELMVGDRYETLERTRETVEQGGPPQHRERMSEVIEWLQREM
ncbi:Lipoyltransferase and lipoate-protein ligase [Rhodotorula sp. JG-1b]|nr:Lipoyltransferase and lipoate-protein ligase [Rhodotorula sp. JG-1b]